jgi:hypothetical protein
MILFVVMVRVCTKKAIGQTSAPTCQQFKAFQIPETGGALQRISKLDFLTLKVESKNPSG